MKDTICKLCGLRHRLGAPCHPAYLRAQAAGGGRKPPASAAVATAEAPGPLCAVCKKPLKAPKRGPQPTICSDKCRMARMRSNILRRAE